MKRKQVADGVTEFVPAKRQRPTAFSPITHQYPADVSHEEIQRARAFCINLLVGVHINQNAQMLGDFIQDSDIANKARQCLSFMCAWTREAGNRMRDGNRADLAVFMEILEEEDWSARMEQGVPTELALPRIPGVAGYRIWFFVDAEDWDPSKVLENMLKSNLELSKAPPSKFSRKPTDHDAINSFDSFIDMVSAKNGEGYHSMINEIKTQDISDPKHPLFLRRLFGAKVAMHKCPRVARRQRTLDLYLRRVGGSIYNGEPLIPFIDLTIRLTDDQSRYDNLLRLQLPTPTSLSKINEITHPEFRTWMEQMGQEDGLDGDGGAPRDEMKEDLVDEISDRTAPPADTFRGIFGSKSSESFGLKADELKVELDAARAKIRQKKALGIKAAGDDATKRRQVQQTAQDEMDQFDAMAIDRFRQIWNRSGCVSPAILAAIEWGENFARDNVTMYCLQQVFSTNLSTANEMVVSFLSEMEGITDNATTHSECFKIWIAILNASDCGLTDKFHMILSGPSAISKSFAMNVMSKYMLPGTWENFTYVTNKANAVGGDLSATVEFFHEIPVQYLGINAAGKAGVQTEAMQMLKDWSTSGRINFKEMFFDADRNRGSRVTKAKKNGVMIGATNLNPDEIDPFVASRYHVAKMRVTNRAGKSIAENICMPKNRSRSGLSKASESYAHRMHYLILLLNTMIEAGVMEEASTAYCSKMLPLVLLEAEKTGVTRGFSSPRSVTRFLAAARTLVKMRAIHIAFFSSVSPWKGSKLPNGTYAGAPWDVSQMRACRPFMCDDDPHIFTLLMGILGDFDDDSLSSVVNAMTATDLTGIDAVPYERRSDSSARDQGQSDSSDCKAPNPVPGRAAASRTGGGRQLTLNGGRRPVNGGRRSQTGAAAPRAANWIDSGNPEVKMQWVPGSAGESTRAPPLEKTDDLYIVNNVFPPNSSDARKIEILSNRWLAKMNPRPQARDVVPVIKSMIATVITLEDGVTQFPQLELTDTGYAIPIEFLIKAACSNRIEKAMIKVMEHSMTIPSMHLVGTDVNNIEPCDLKLVEIKKNKEVLVISRPDFFPEDRVNIIKAKFAGNPRLGVDFDDAFPRDKAQIVNEMPLEVECFLKHQDDICWTSKRLSIMKAVPENVLCGLMRKAQDDLLKDYERLVGNFRKQCKLPDPEASVEAEKQFGAKPVKRFAYNPEAMKASRISPHGQDPSEKKRPTFMNAFDESYLRAAQMVG